MLPTESERDWTEDFGHENGRYICRCFKCNAQFYGHKRRVMCRICHTGAAMTKSPAPLPADVESIAKRHQLAEDSTKGAGEWLADYASDAHADRGALLAYVRTLAAQVAGMEAQPLVPQAFVDQIVSEMVGMGLPVEMTHKNNFKPNYIPTDWLKCADREEEIAMCLVEGWSSKRAMIALMWLLLKRPAALKATPQPHDAERARELVNSIRSRSIDNGDWFVSTTQAQTDLICAFAEVRAQEREACAKVAETLRINGSLTRDGHFIATAIREGKHHV